MAAIADADVSINPTSGAIRWTGAATTNKHTVLEFIQWLMDKQDDEQAAGDDLLDITVDTPFNRSTDQIVTLNSPFNIDDTFATHLYDGSVAQTDPTYGGETLYSGLRVLGPVETGTEYMILQNGGALPAFWGTGINAEDSPSLVFSRHLVKSKFAGSKIDGQRITVLAREYGDQYRRFPVTLGTGNSVAAIGNGTDIFATTADATVAAWTITNTEGFQQIDIDGNGTADTVNEYYSQWGKGVQSVNDVYEYSKWITQRAHLADAVGGTPTGTDYVIDNGTDTFGHAQNFVPLTNVNELLTEVRAQIKIGAGTPTGTIYAELYDSNDAAHGSAVPTGAVLARSEAVLASAITSSYEEVIFRFNRFNPDTGAEQYSGLSLANTEYFINFSHDDGTAGAYFHMDGGVAQDAALGSALENPADTWTGSVNEINIEVYSSPPIHGVPGEIFQGINVAVAYDAEGGVGVDEDDLLAWGSVINYDGLTDTFIEGEPITVRVDSGGAVRSGGHVLYDDGSNLIVALDTLSAGIISTDDIEGLVSGATANVTSITNGDKGGGTGILLAQDDNTGSGELYIQVLSGVNPVNDSIIYSQASDADSVTATAVINTKTIVPEFLGTSTGSNIIGAYGIGFNKDDVGASDRFEDLEDGARTPQNNQPFTVSGLTSGEDRVLVGPRTGSALDRGQWLLNTALTATNETSIVVKTGGTEAVPWKSTQINWPTTGTSNDVSALRVETDGGIYRNVDYASHDSSNTFTVSSATGEYDFSSDNASANNDVFLAFIDVLASASTASFTGVHLTNDRNLFVRVRDGGGTPIVTFESTSAQFKSTPQTVAAVRTDDY